MSADRLREDTSQGGELRYAWLDGNHAILVRLLECSEEKDSVPPNRTAERAASMFPPEKRIAVERIPLQRGIRSHVVISKEKERAAVEVVPSRTGHDVDGSATAALVRQIEIDCRYLEFLYDLR